MTDIKKFRDSLPEKEKADYDYVFGVDFDKLGELNKDIKTNCTLHGLQPTYDMIKFDENNDEKIIGVGCRECYKGRNRKIKD